jgi:hydrogenase nickel incorporation protein HypA/HybF
MHELGIAAEVIEAATTAAAGARIATVCVRVGELSGVDAEALRFSFEALTAGTAMEKVKLEIEPRRRTHRCKQCDATFEADGYGDACPACNSPQFEIAGGMELDIAWVEVEDA